MDSFREGTEDDAQLGQLGFKGGAYGDAVKHRVHSYTRQQLAFLQRNAQLLVRLQQLRIDVIKALRTVARFLRSRVVADGLIIDGGELHVRPRRLHHFQPVAISLQAPFQQPNGLALLGGDQTNHVFVQPRRHGFLFNVRNETVFVFLCRQNFEIGLRCCHLEPPVVSANW